METISIAICNQKGGVGKTTLSINLGAALAHQGDRVLLIDLDPQGHLTEGVGLRSFYEKEGESFFKKLVHNEGDLSRLIQQPERESFWVIPATYEMMLAEQALFMAKNREHKLKKVLETLSGKFDWILIDCPPTLGNLTDNALNATQRVLVPVQAESTSIRALELLFDQIESLETVLEIRIEKVAVVPNLVQDSAMSKRTLDGMRSSLPTVTPFELRKRVILQNAWDAGHSIFSLETHSYDANKAKASVIEDYILLADFVRQRVKRD